MGCVLAGRLLLLLLCVQAEVAGKDEPALKRLLAESEDMSARREALRKRLALLQRAAKEIALCI